MRKRISSLLSPAVACLTLSCAAIVATLFCPGPRLAQEAPAKLAPDYLHELSDSFQSLTRKVSPAVVQILVTSFGPVREGGEDETALIGRQHVTGSEVRLAESSVGRSASITWNLQTRKVGSPDRYHLPAQARYSYSTSEGNSRKRRKCGFESSHSRRGSAMSSFSL